MLRKFFLFAFLFGFLLPSTAFCVSPPNGTLTKSSDGRTELRVYLEDGKLLYKVDFDGKPVITPSQLGLKFQGQADLKFQNHFFTAIKTDSVDQDWEYPWGRQRKYKDKFNRTIVTAETEDGKSLAVECRVYDDGVALRYLIDEKTVGGNEYVLEKDLTQFNFNGDPVGWFTDFGGFNSSQEKEYPKNNLSTIGQGAHVGCPVVVKIGEGGPYVALTEAELNHWGGLYFEGQDAPGIRDIFDSGVMKAGDKAREFYVPLRKAFRLELIAEDGGDGIGSDHADWVNMTLFKKDGTKVDLSTLKPMSNSQDWGALRINKSCDNNPLKIAGIEYKTGFGTHAVSKITFELNDEYSDIRGLAGVDDEKEGQGTVRFRIRTVPKPDNVRLQATLSPRHDDQGLTATKIGPGPWRLIIVAPKAINLVDQTILMNVSAPTDPSADWSWIQPGTASWDWWSDSNSNMRTEAIKPFIDYASEMGWQFHFLDDPWYAGKKYRMGDPRNNVLKGSDETDVEELVKYAKEKKIRLFLWLNWKDIDRQMEEAFALYEKWGIAGVKIDFMDRDDQEMVEWYDKTVRLAAKHKLMVDFHGSYKPTGYRRAWPNLITREGIYGNEQNKWTKLSAEHYCTLPYTRLMLGPGDFTPGAILNRHFPGDRGVPGYNTAQGMGTRCHEWAICLLYDSPILCLCDRPELYRTAQPAMEFFRNLPTVWDESRGVEGEVGEYFSLIRRKGDDWYYAAITDNTERELTLKLDFLGDGNYEATIYADCEATKTDARRYVIEKKTVTTADTLNVKMTAGGGQAIVFKKK